MRHLVHLARFHPGYGFHHGMAHGSGWITQMIISSVIHGLIYSVIFRALRHLSLGEVVLIAAVVIALIYSARRSPRRW